MKARWLVTGGRGFIGRNLFNHLTGQGHDVTVMDIKDGPKYNLCFPFSPQVTSWDVCVHLAAMTDVRFSLEHPSQVIDNNLAMTLNCIEGLNRGMFGQMIFTSSASSYTNQNPYLASKTCCEASIIAYNKSIEHRIHIAKLPNIYGPHSEHKSSVIPEFIKACFTNTQPLIINGDGEQTRIFVHVDDVCRMIATLEDGFAHPWFQCSINDLARYIQAISSREIGKCPEIMHMEPIKGEVDRVSLYSGEDTLEEQEFIDRLRSTFRWFKKEVYNG